MKTIFAKEITIIAVFAVAVAAQSRLWAQGNTGSLGGVTMDEQRLRVPSVSLTLQDTEGGLKRTLVSGVDGAFQFTGLPPGEYKLTVISSGFQPTELRVTLEVN